MIRFSRSRRFSIYEIYDSNKNVSEEEEANSTSGNMIELKSKEEECVKVRERRKKKKVMTKQVGYIFQFKCFDFFFCSRKGESISTYCFWFSGPAFLPLDSCPQFRFLYSVLFCLSFVDSLLHLLALFCDSLRWPNLALRGDSRQSILSSWLLHRNGNRETFHAQCDSIDRNRNTTGRIYCLVCSGKSRATIEESPARWNTNGHCLDSLRHPTVLCENNDHGGDLWSQFGKRNVLGWNANTAWRSSGRITCRVSGGSHRHLSTSIINLFSILNIYWQIYLITKHSNDWIPYLSWL